MRSTLIQELDLVRFFATELNGCRIRVFADIAIDGPDGFTTFVNLLRKDAISRV
jgi:hypothetical protein